jgi:hypothetical protein
LHRIGALFYHQLRFSSFTLFISFDNTKEYFTNKNINTLKKLMIKIGLISFLIRGGKTGRARRADPFDPQFLTGWGEVFGPLP